MAKGIVGRHHQGGFGNGIIGSWVMAHRAKPMERPHGIQRSNKAGLGFWPQGARLAPGQIGRLCIKPCRVVPGR
jgi:hypothetical protein